MRSWFGVNPVTPVDYSGATEFVDCFRTARPFTDPTGTTQFPKNTYPTSSARQTIFTDGPQLLNGEYSIYYKGQVSLSLTGGSPAKLGVLRTEGDYNVQPVTITATGNSTAQLHLVWGNPVGLKDIKILRPGYDLARLAKSPFTDAFGGLLTGLGSGILRSLSWFKINSSPVIQKIDFPELEDLLWVGQDKVLRPPEDTDTGAPPELFFDACREFNQQPWLTIPHLASDDCIAWLFQQALDLPSDMWIYWQLTNEHWNTDPRFNQSKWYQVEAAKLGITADTFFMQQVGRVVRISRDVFGQEAYRLRPIVDGHINNSAVLRNCCQCPEIDQVWGLAVTGYFGSNATTVQEVEASAKAIWRGDQADKFFKTCVDAKKVPCVYEGGASGGDSSTDVIKQAKKLLHLDPAIQEPTELGMMEFRSAAKAAGLDPGPFIYFVLANLYKDNFYGLTPTSYNWMTPKVRAFANVARLYSAPDPDPIPALRAQIKDLQQRLTLGGSRLNDIAKEIDDLRRTIYG